MTQTYPLRPREKLAQSSAQTLTDHELLQALLGSGSKGFSVKRVARSVMRLFRRSNGVLTYADLYAIPGLGAAYAARIMAAFELTRRWQSLVYVPQVYVPMSELLGRENVQSAAAMIICDLYNAAQEVVDRLFIKVRQNEKPATIIRMILTQTVPTQAVIAHVGIVGDHEARKDFFSDMLFLESLKATLAFIDASLLRMSVVDASGVVTEVIV